MKLWREPKGEWENIGEDCEDNMAKVMALIADLTKNLHDFSL